MIAKNARRRYNPRMDSPDSPPQAFVDTAIAAADAARAITAGYFRGNLTVANKTDGSPVTVADREAEQCIRELILARHPAHYVYGEEGGAHGAGDRHDDGDSNSDSNSDGDDDRHEWRWLIDPIDGTKAFATGNPTFGTLIALLHDARAVIGVIDHAALDERWLGVRGAPTVHNGARCQTAATQQLATASLCATTPDMFAGESRAPFARLSAAVRFRAFGGDCLNYGLLASGHADLVCESGLQPHDFMALATVVEGAGGVISDWRGAPLSPASDGCILASANETLHRAALAALGW